jgi:hypothetical protein
MGKLPAQVPRCYFALHRILHQENLHMFLRSITEDNLEDLAVSGASVISISLFRVAVLLLIVGSQKMLLLRVL